MKSVIVDKNGVKVEDIDPNTVSVILNYDSIVTDLIRSRYSLDDEFAITNNRMAVFDANLLTQQKEEEYNKEYYEYQIFRESCKKKAREICSITAK